MPPAALTDDSMRQQILSGASRRSWAGVQTGFLMLERRNRRRLKTVPHPGQADGFAASRGRPRQRRNAAL